MIVRVAVVSGGNENPTRLEDVRAFDTLAEAAAFVAGANAVDDIKHGPYVYTFTEGDAEDWAVLAEWAQEGEAAVVAEIRAALGGAR